MIEFVGSMVNCKYTKNFINEWARMCQSCVCGSCPLGIYENCNDFIKRHPSEAIRIVQKWSDENEEDE